jgi:two-component system sensor histidine kinase UhpB
VNTTPDVPKPTPLLDLLFDEPEVGHCLARADGRVQRVNDAWLRVTTQVRHQVLGANLSELMPLGTGPAAALIERALHGERIEVAPSGRPLNPLERRWHATLQSVTFDGERYLLLSARAGAPVGEATAAQTLEAILACVPEGLAISSSTVTSASSLWGETLLLDGWKSGQGASMTQWLERVEVCRPDGVTRVRLEELPLWRASHRGETVSNEEFVLWRPDGQRLTVLASAAPIRDAHGACAGGVTVWRDVTASRRAQQSAREVERAFLDALEQLNEGFYALDREWRLTYLNGPTAEKFGLPPEALVGKVLWEARPSVLGSPQEALLRRVMAQRLPESLEVQGTLDDRWYRVSCAPTASGGISVLYADITERRRNGLALLEADSTRQAIFDAASESLWLFSVDGVVLAGNPTALRRVAARSATIIGQSLAEILPPALAASRLARLRECAQTRAPVTFEDTREGTWLEHTFCPVFGNDGRVDRVAGFTRDITGLRVRDQALKASEERLRLGSQAAGFGTFTFAYATRTAEWSPEIFAIWGLPPGTPVTGDEFGLPGHLHPDDRATLEQATRAATAPTDDARGSFHTEFRIRQPDGAIRWLRLSGQTTFTGKGQARRAERLTGAVIDVTWARQLETQLRALTGRLQNVRELDQARIARDLHDDLTQVLAGLGHHLLKLEDWVHQTRAPGWLEDWAVETTELVNQAHASVRRIASGLRPRTLDSLGLGPALTLEASRFHERSGVECEVTLGVLPELPLPAVTALYRIAQEALTNVSRHAAASKVTIRLAQEGAELVLRVEDNGQGLRSSGDSIGGLGLLGMRERAALLGGTVRLEANQPAGLAVIAALPLASAAG